MAAQAIRALGVAISATGVIAGAFGHFSTQVGLWVRAPNHGHCARIPENLARRTPAWGEAEPGLVRSGAARAAVLGDPREKVSTVYEGSARRVSPATAEP